MNKKGLKSVLPVFLLLLTFGLSSGCATTPTSGAGIEANPDPLEPTNRTFFGLNEALDKFFMKPVANAYVTITPQPVRTSVTNFFDNLSYLNVVLNSFLQGKLEQGFSDVFRFVVNSTVGIGGLLDVATPMGMEKHEEDLGQTFAVWGFGQGSYLYIPVEGPNTVRNLPNYATRYFLNPLTYVTSTVLFPVAALNIINTRANLLEATNIRDEAAVDSYSFTREAYLQRRNYLIYDGNPPTEGYEDIFEDDTGEDVLIIE